MVSGTQDDSVRHARLRAILTLGLFAAGTLISANARPGTGSRPGAGMDAASDGTFLLYTLGAGTLMLALGIIVPARARAGMLGVCVLLLGAGWVGLRTDANRPDRIGTIVGTLDAKTTRVPIEVRGMVREPSRIQRRETGLADPPMWPDRSNRALLGVESVLLHEANGRQRWEQASGDVRLVLDANLKLHAGERVELLGLFSLPASRRNPGEPDWAALAAQQGLAGTLVIEQASHIRPLGKGGLPGQVRAAWWALRASLRERAMASIGIGDENYDDDASGMRAALLLGQREPSFDDVFGQFQRVGVAHVLAISGFHLALVVLILALGVRVLGEHPRLEALVVLVALVGVVVLIPLRPPVVRAAVIVGAMLLATRVGRRYDRMTILAWVGLGLLIWRPLDASSMGYQLSMGVTALLVTLNDRRQRLSRAQQVGVMALPKGRGTLMRAALRVWDVFKLNFACWAVALPVVMYHAGVVGVLAPIASLLVVPMVAGLMVLGYAQILLGIVSPDLAQHTLWLVDALSGWTLSLVSWIDTLGFAWVRVPAMSVWWAGIATLVMALIVTRRVCWYRPLGAALLLIVIGLGTLEPMLTRAGAALRVVMLDVGDGSCVVLQSGNTGLLWDCGSLDRRVGDSVGAALRRMGITRLAGVLVTHDNIDHYNGLPDLAQRLAITGVHITDRLERSPSKAWERVRSHLHEQGIHISTLRAGDRLSLGEASIRVLWPTGEIDDSYDDNDTSLVVLIELPDAPAVLLSGDIEAPAMDQISAAYPGLAQTLAGGVIELPHHGSARDRAYDFVDWLNPQVIMQSTGPSRLEDARWDAIRPGRAWYTTAQRGAIIIELGRDGSLTHRYWFDE